MDEEKVSLNVRVPVSLRRRIKAIVATSGLDMGEVLAKVIYWLEANQKLEEIACG